MSADTTFITRYDTSGPGVRLAVKDLIDMAGEVTTAGCRAVARRAVPAEQDAACLKGARDAGARIVGRTNLHELALGVTGVNPWYGTPVNPLDPALVPGGSSSGSAVAVATGEADVAYGSDTGGSVRIPAACCGVAGLKTTWGRIPLDGVWPLAPSFDTVGPMARDVGGLVTGMQLLEPGFEVAAVGDVSEVTVARLPIDADPAITAAIDRGAAPGGLGLRRPRRRGVGRRLDPGGPPARRRGLALGPHAGRRGSRGHRRRRAGAPGAGWRLRRRRRAGRVGDPARVAGHARACARACRLRRDADADHLPAASRGG